MLEFGAREVVLGSDAEAIEARAGTLDLLNTTMNANIDWDAYIGMLGPFGRVHVVRTVMEPIPVGAISLVMQERSISESPVASSSDTRWMVDFAGRHGISRHTEHFPIESINGALDHLLSGNARYRLFLDLPSWESSESIWTVGGLDRKGRLTS